MLLRGARQVHPSKVRGVSGLIALLVAVQAICISAAPATASERVWEDLREDAGMVILYRHALAPGGGDPSDFDVKDCSTQRNLSDAGRRQARAMGDALRENKVNVRRVLSSPWCRSRETAELMKVGPVRTMMRFGSTFTAPSAVAQRRESLALKTIARQSNRSGVVVVSSHQANIVDLTGIAPTSGEGIVVRYTGEQLTVIGRVPAPAIR
jgi:phosphohistidine phosphatase SixA